ncbi:MAG: hypothetical protein AB7N76_23910 [Planctomycetota bacterium]
MSDTDELDDRLPEDGPPGEEGPREEKPRGRRGAPPPASEKQLNFVRLLKDKVGLTDEEFARMLGDVCGTEDLETLDIAQASEMIDALQTEARERGVDLDSQPRASEKQVGFILSLKRRAHLTDAEFKQLLQDVCGVEVVEEVGRRDASALIDQLKARADAARGDGGAGGSGGGGREAAGRSRAGGGRAGGGGGRSGGGGGGAAPAPKPAPRPVIPEADDDDIPF